MVSTGVERALVRSRAQPRTARCRSSWTRHGPGGPAAAADRGAAAEAVERARGGVKPPASRSRWWRSRTRARGAPQRTAGGGLERPDC
ncbi:hypothetical protein QJS66_08075 [Kocuria rhizophila]|nr:hypothetical protein QJS66_08075 [Kocuria rhizophila]